MTDPTATSEQGDRWTTALDGTRLRQLRHQHGVSQEQLADRAGISLTTITRLERQPRAACRCRTLSRLAAALGQPPTALTQQPHPAQPGVTPP
jgi:transcriptional regulator with XRE-family HTH domain